MLMLAIIAALASLFILACLWAGVRDRYDHARWQVEPYYPRYGASNLRVLRWWLGGALAVVLLLASQASARDLDGRLAAEAVVR